MAAVEYVNAAAVGVPIAEWLTLTTALREAIVTEHNDRITDR